jgi:S-DNA-T family DNA segregation ATPase FtsK/SpoIIIE
VLFVAVAGVLIAAPWSRRMLLVVAGCLVTQTRLRTGLIELRLTTHGGRLPFVLWLVPTPVGERVCLWCRAGVSPEDIADETDGLRSACFARRSGSPETGGGPRWWCSTWSGATRWRPVDRWRPRWRTGRDGGVPVRSRGRRAADGLSIWQPVHLGIDETGTAVRVTLAERNLLIGGEPGAGKSVTLNLIVAHAALSLDCRLVLVDGKRVELGLWRACADTFVGSSIAEDLTMLYRRQSIMDCRHDVLLTGGRRKITAAGGVPVVLVVVDELAYFSTTVGEPKQQKEFVTLVRDLVARGRAAGIIVVAATQWPSADIVPTSLRDLLGYRWRSAARPTPART